MGVSLADVHLEDLLQWMESLVYRRYSKNTISLKISVVKSLFSYATKIGYLNLNVTAALSAPSQVNALHERFLEQEEVRKLIEAAKNKRDRSLLSLIYTTGLRASEALGINWQDLQPRTNGGQVTVMGKGNKMRTVLINQSLWQQLTSLKNSEFGIQNPELGENNSELLTTNSELSQALFVTKFGNRLDRHQLHRIIKDCAKRAGVNAHVSAHWLRHAHACHSLENGCDIDVLMRSLGHSSLTVTSKYLHALT